MKAALELIEEAEPFSFTLREAAKRAGVAVSAPYRHFENKAALMTAIAEEGAQRMNAMMIEEMELAGDSPEAKFQAMGIAFVKFAVSHPGYFRVLHAPENVRVDVSPGLQQAFAENTAMVTSLFQQMQSEGVLEDGNPMLQFLSAQSMTYGLARMFVDGQMARFGLESSDAVLVAKAVTGVLGMGLAPRKEQADAGDSNGLTDDEESKLTSMFAVMMQHGERALEDSEDSVSNG